DRTDIGGSPAIPAGVGPNIRTVMRIVVAGTGGTAPVNDFNPATLTALQTAFASTPTTPGVFAAAQDPVIVGQKAYGTGTGNSSAYNVAFPYTYPYWGLSNIFSTTLSFMKTDGTLVNNYPMLPKAIHDEMGGTFDDYGRMSAKLGLEVLNSNAALSTFSMQTYVDPATEIVRPGQAQIWKITHNGVDTHPIHFHLFDVQLINRVGWDGFIRLPDANELGWKDTVRISPLEDTIVALRPVTPRVPFALPNSIRPLNPTQPIGSTMGFGQLDPLTGAALDTLTTNKIVNFAQEYVWHCHILSHEENDMMRAVVFAVKPPQGDFNGIGKTDIAIWRPGDTGQWWIKTPTGTANVINWGTTGDKLVPGDYDGDRKTDVAVWRPSDGNWYIINSSDSTQNVVNYGITGDTPVPGDYDGDGKADIAVWRPSNGNWYVKNSATNTQSVVNYGTSGDIPVSGDYDGDGKADIAVWRPSNGNWYVKNSATNTQSVVNFGTSGDIPVPGDYDGDNKIDMAVWRNGTWYIKNSATNTQTVVSFGTSGDIPVPGDYENLGRTEIAVWRPSNGKWYILNPVTNAQNVVTWGDPTDQPSKVFQPVQ
ncbi:MAG: FG-GAP-like repeat-containing protein, partial [Desulfuromonadaceae bacterium]